MNAHCEILESDNFERRSNSILKLYNFSCEIQDARPRTRKAFILKIALTNRLLDLQPTRVYGSVCCVSFEDR